MTKFLIVSFGLEAHNSRLMPWRTVLEVAKGLERKGHKATILSILKEDGAPINGVSQVVSIRRRKLDDMRREMTESLDSLDFDVVFVPVSWSPNRLVRKLLNGLNGIRIAYLPGSVFELTNVWWSVGKMPFRQLLPYITQAVFPTWAVGLSLRALQASALITNSSYSKRYIESRINLRVEAIQPGRDPVNERDNAGEYISTGCFKNQTYFLFMGPPLHIRGLFILLRAYERIADEQNMPSLLCLFRSDNHLDIPQIKSEIESRWTHQKIRFIWESMEPDELQVYVSQAVAVVMPFLVVPSEIPLAVYEAAGMGKVVITTGPHGTGEFVGQFGEAVRAGSVDALVSALRRVSRAVQSDGAAISQPALTAHRTLQSWQSVAERWGSLAEEYVATS